MSSLHENMQLIGKQARAAAMSLLKSNAHMRQQVLYAIADKLNEKRQSILQANQQDIEQAKKNNMAPAMLDRLTLDDVRLNKMIEGVKQVSNQPDVLGSISDLHYGQRGFQIGKMRIPIGVIGIIYESRPNVTVDAAAICIKSGNACILRGGSEAFYSNQALVQCVREAIATTDLDKNIVQFIDTTDREAVNAMLQASGLIDVVIPRGGKGLVKLISETARVPVIKHLDGICHVYIDEYADSNMAIEIALNAKTYRYGICGAMETLLIHQQQVEKIMPKLLARFAEKGVTIVADKTLADKYQLNEASEEDWSTEYSAAKLSIATVDDIHTAISHINQYGSHHTDSIVTQHIGNQNLFLNLVDSASVMVNTPTCFADGFEYGLGAEIGISTDKLHARGPVGVLGLTTEKFIVLGNGELRD